MMLRCTRCEGFVPPALDACPNCKRSGRGVLAVLGAGAAALTLMACYGAPPSHLRANVPPDPVEVSAPDAGTP